jgi:hypothetical protein
MNGTIIWDMMPCSLVEFPSVLKEYTDTCFLLVTCLVYFASLKMEAVSCSEILVDLYQTTWYCIPEDSTQVTAVRTSRPTHLIDFVISVFCCCFVQRSIGNMTNNTMLILRIDYCVKK